MLQRQSAPEKTPNWDSINTKVFEEEGVRFGEGEEKLSAESFSSPSPNLTPSSSKTFVFIESQFGVFSGADCLWSMGTSKDTIQVKGCRFSEGGGLCI